MSTKHKSFKIVLWAGDELLRVLEMSGAARKQQPELGSRNPNDSNGAAREPTEDQQKAMDALVEQGVTPSKARELVQAYTLDHILDQIDYGLSQVAADRGARKKIYNPAGFIIHHIENNLSVPFGFVTSRQRKRLQEEEIAKEAAQKVQDECLAEEWHRYQRWKDEQVTIEISARYPTQEALDEKIQDIVKTRVLPYDRGAREWSLALRKATAMNHLRHDIASELQLPGPAEWREQRPQGELF